ncbi:MAG: carboxypeptidase regulatory-like domain-containing protein [Acidobacteriota bacterium]
MIAGLALALSLAPGVDLTAISEIDLGERRVLADPADARSWEAIDVRASGKGTRRVRAGERFVPPTLEPEIVLRGRVTDESGAPVADASVRVYPELVPEVPIAATHGGAEGAYRIEGLSAGRYRVEADAPAFEQSVTWLVLDAPGASLSLDLRLASGWSCAVVVKDAAGAPVTDASVLAVGRGSRVVQRRTTDGSGRAYLHGLARGESYAIVARPRGLWPEHATVDEASPNAEIACRKGRPLEIALEGAPRARLLASTPGDDLELVAAIDEGTPLKIDNAPDRCELRVEAPGRPAVIQTVRGSSSARLAVPVGIAARGMVAGARHPISGAEVWLSGRAGPPDAITGADGLFLLHADRAGAVFDASAPGHARVTERAPARVLLPAKAEINLSVRDRESRRGVTAYRLALTDAGRSDPDDRDVFRWSDAEVRTGSGMARIDGIPAGRYVLRVLAPGHRPWQSTELVLRDTVPIDVLLDRGLELRGRVVERATGKPIAGARVWGRALDELTTIDLPGPDTFTDAAGGFSLGGLARFPAAVTAMHARYSPASAPVATGAPAVTIEMGRGGSIRALVPGKAGVEVRASHGVLVVTATTDDHGIAVLGPLRPGEYRVSARSKPRTDIAIANVAEGRETRVQLGGRVHVWGQVTSRGRPVAPASLSFEDAGGGHQTTVELDAAGSYEVNLDPGAEIARVSIAGGAPYEATIRVTIPDQPDARLDLALPSAAIEGTVLDAASRQPIEGARVLVARSASGDRSTETDAQGRFVVEDLDDGAYELVARAAGHGFARLPGIAVTDGHGPAPLEILLEGGGALNVTISRASGTPVLEAILTILDAAGNALPLEAQNVANAGGQLAVDGISPGVYTLLATAPGLAPSVAGGIDVREGAPTTVAMTMTPGGGVSARAAPGHERSILVPTASPLQALPAAWVAKLLAEKPSPAGWLFEHVPPGGYEVVFQGSAGDARRPIIVAEGTVVDVSP